MNTNASAPSASAGMGGVVLDGESVRAMRRRLHELANVLTGVMIAAGLLAQYLEGGTLASYAADICDGSERGSEMVREIRGQLLTACGEVELPSGAGAVNQVRGQ